jgi:hypothetical protein
MKTSGLILIAGLLFLLNGQLVAQESKGLGIGVGADMASRYLWRGLNIGGDCAHIQPYVSASYKFLEVGAWSSYGLSNNNENGTNYFEYDLYAKLTVKNFGLAFTNYDIQDYGSSSEISLSYEGGEKLPLHASFNKYVINDDASYIDLGYEFFSEKLVPLDLVVGATPAAGSYGDKGGIVNISLTAKYETMKSEKFSLPVFSTFMYNPQIEKSFFVVGITLSTK